MNENDKADKENTAQERDIILNGMKSGRFRFSDHAYDRAGERTVTRQDVIEVGFNYFDWAQQDGGKFLFIGDDVDGIELKVVAVYDGETVIVSVI